MGQRLKAAAAYCYHYLPIWWPILLIALLLFAFQPLIGLGAFHLRAIEAVNADEGDFAWRIYSAFQRGDYELNNYQYGQAYYNLLLWLGFATAKGVHLEPHQIVMLLRGYSLFWLVAMSGLTFIIVRPYSSRLWAAIGSVCLFGLTHNLLSFGVMLHPDTMQAALLMGSLYFLMQALKKQQADLTILGSALLLGLAISVKYAGIALLPLLIASPFTFKLFRNQWLILCFGAFAWVSVYSYQYLDLTEITQVLAAYPTESASRMLLGLKVLKGLLIPLFLLVTALATGLVLKPNLRWARYAKALITTCGLGALVALSYAATSPLSLEKYRVISGFVEATSVHESGHWFVVENGLWPWLKTLFGADAVPIYWLIPLLAALIGVLMRAIKSKAFELLLIPLWCALFLSTLSSNVGSKFVHYLMPIYIFFPALIAIGLSYWLKQKQVELSLLIAVSLLSIYSVQSFKANQIATYEQHAGMKAGFWLAENMTKPAKVLADRYVYVPALEGVAYYTNWGLNVSLIEEIEPTYIAIHPNIYTRFTNKNIDPKGYKYGEALFLERQQLYSRILSNELLDYEKVYEVDSVVIVKKKSNLTF